MLPYGFLQRLDNELHPLPPPRPRTKRQQRQEILFLTVLFCLFASLYLIPANVVSLRKQARLSQRRREAMQQKLAREVTLEPEGWEESIWGPLLNRLEAGGNLTATNWVPAFPGLEVRELAPIRVSGVDSYSHSVLAPSPDEQRRRTATNSRVTSFYYSVFNPRRRTFISKIGIPEYAEKMWVRETVELGPEKSGATNEDGKVRGVSVARQQLKYRVPQKQWKRVGQEAEEDSSYCQGYVGTRFTREELLIMTMRLQRVLVESQEFHAGVKRELEKCRQQIGMGPSTESRYPDSPSQRFKEHGMLAECVEHLSKQYLGREVEGEFGESLGELARWRFLVNVYLRARSLSSVDVPPLDHVSSSAGLSAEVTSVFNNLIDQRDGALMELVQILTEVLLRQVISHAVGSLGHDMMVHALSSSFHNGATESILTETFQLYEFIVEYRAVMQKSPREDIESLMRNNTPVAPLVSMARISEYLEEEVMFARERWDFLSDSPYHRENMIANLLLARYFPGVTLSTLLRNRHRLPGFIIHHVASRIVKLAQETDVHRKLNSDERRLALDEEKLIHVTNGVVQMPRIPGFLNSSRADEAVQPVETGFWPLSAARAVLVLPQTGEEILYLLPPEERAPSTDSLSETSEDKIVTLTYGKPESRLHVYREQLQYRVVGERDPLLSFSCAAHVAPLDPPLKGLVGENRPERVLHLRDMHAAIHFPKTEGRDSEILQHHASTVEQRAEQYLRAIHDEQGENARAVVVDPASLNRGAVAYPLLLFGRAVGEQIHWVDRRVRLEDSPDSTQKISVYSQPGGHCVCGGSQRVAPLQLISAFMAHKREKSIRKWLHQREQDLAREVQEEERAFAENKGAQAELAQLLADIEEAKRTGGAGPHKYRLQALRSRYHQGAARRNFEAEKGAISLMLWDLFSTFTCANQCQLVVDVELTSAADNDKERAWEAFLKLSDRPLVVAGRDEVADEAFKRSQRERYAI